MFNSPGLFLNSASLLSRAKWRLNANNVQGTGDGNGYADGTALTNWVDLMPGANTANQGTALNKPLFKTNIQNGKPGILFDGANSQRMDTPEFDLGTSPTIIFTLKPTNTSNAQVFDLANVPATIREINVNTFNNLLRAALYDGSINNGFVSSSAPINNSYVFCYRYDAAGTGLATPFINGVAGSTAAITTDAAGSFARRIGGHPTDLSSWFNGYMFEGIAFDFALTDAQIISVSQDRGTYWGIY